MSARPKSARERTVTGRTNTSGGNGGNRQSEQQWSARSSGRQRVRPSTAGATRKTPPQQQQQQRRQPASSGNNQTESPGRQTYNGYTGKYSGRSGVSRTSGVTTARSEYSSRQATIDHPDAWEVCFTPHDHTYSARRPVEEFGFDKHDFEDGLKVPVGNRPPRPRPVRPRTAPMAHNARTAAPEEDEQGGRESFGTSMKKWNKHHLFNVELEPETRVRVAKDFVERNRDCVHKLDPEFRGKSHRQIFHILLQEDAFAARLMQLEDRARSYISGTSSDAVKRCFDESPVPGMEPRRTLTREQSLRAGIGYGRYKATPPIESDPFLRSLTTSRERKAEQQDRLFRPLYNQYGGFKRQGGKDPFCEYGSFSKFNGLLQLNKGACGTRMELMETLLPLVFFLCCSLTLSLRTRQVRS